MNALKGMFFVLLAVVLIGGCYVSSVILGWVLAILATVSIIVLVVAVLLHETFTHFTQSGKKPPRKQ